MPFIHLLQSIKKLEWLNQDGCIKQHVGLILIILAILFSFQYFSGGTFINVFASDYNISIDQIYRMRHNVMPYIDFPSSIGPLYYILLYITGMIFPIEWAPSFFGFFALPLMIPCFILLRSRLKENLALCVLLVSWMFVLAPRPFDLFFNYSSFLAPYNTLSLALFTSVLMALIPVKKEETILNCFCFFILVIACFMLKASYGLLAIFALSLSFMWPYFERRLALVGVIFISLIFMLAASVSLVLNFRDIIEISSVMSVTERVLYKMQNITQKSFTYFFLSFLFLAWMERIRLNTSWRWTASGFVVTGLIWGSVINDHSEVPALFFMILIINYLAVRTIKLPTKSGKIIEKNLVAMSSIALAFMLFWHGSQSFASSFNHFIQSNVEIVRFQKNPQIFYASIGDMEEWVQDRKKIMNILKRENLDTYRSVTLDVSQISWLTRSPPAKYVPAWNDHMRTFNETTYPIAMLDDADIVIYPKGIGNRKTSETLLMLLTPQIVAHFTEVYDDDKWQIWIRKTLQ